MRRPGPETVPGRPDYKNAGAARERDKKKLRVVTRSELYQGKSRKAPRGV